MLYGWQLCTFFFFWKIENFAVYILIIEVISIVNTKQHVITYINICDITNLAMNSNTIFHNLVIDQRSINENWKRKSFPHTSCMVHCFFFFFEIVSNLWHLLLMIVLYYQTKVLIDFFSVNKNWNPNFLFNNKKQIAWCLNLLQPFRFYRTIIYNKLLHANAVLFAHFSFGSSFQEMKWVSFLFSWSLN